MSHEEETQKLIDNSSDFGPENDQCGQEPVDCILDEEKVGQDRTVKKKERKTIQKSFVIRLKTQREEKDENKKKTKNKKQKMRLKAQKEAFSEEKHVLEEQKEAFSKEKQELEDEINHLKTEVKRLTEENTRLTTGMSSQQCGSQINAEELTETLQQMTSERDELQKRSEIIGQSKQKLTSELGNVKNDLEEAEKKCAMLSENLTDYKFGLRRKEEELESVKSSLNGENKALKDHLKEMESKHEVELKEFRVSRENEMKQWEKSYNKLLHNKENELQRVKDAYEIRLRELESEISIMKPHYEYYPQLENERKQLGFKLRNAEESIKTLQKDIYALEEEKKDLLLRLSKIAGANLTYNNPNIADLSDEKRPTKLAEEFSELYDNEWTDAFEDVDISDEKAKTTFMLELLQLAYQLCQHVSTEHSQNIQRSLSTLTVSMVDNAPPAEQKSDKRSEDTTLTYEVEENNTVEILEIREDYTDTENKDAKAHHNCESIPNASTNTTEEDQAKSDEKAKQAETENDAEDKQTSCKSIQNTATINTIEEDEARKDKKAKPVETENDAENNQNCSGSDINTALNNTEEDEAVSVEKVIEGGDNQNGGESILNATNGTTEDNDTKNGEEAKPLETAIERLLTADMETLNVRNEQKKAVQDIQKLVEKTLSVELQEVGAELIAIHKGIDLKKDVPVSVYIQRCINVCWSMCLQEPPVHVDIGDVTGEPPFDNNKYKPYTKSGKYMDFIVWPALYLHKGGPMLSKGVAQGRK